MEEKQTNVVSMKKPVPPKGLNRDQLRAWRKEQRAREKLTPEQIAAQEAAEKDRAERRARKEHAETQPVTPQAMRELADKEFSHRFPELLKNCRDQIRLNASYGSHRFGLGCEIETYREKLIEALGAEGFHIAETTKEGFVIDLRLSTSAAATETSAA